MIVSALTLLSLSALQKPLFFSTREELTIGGEYAGGVTGNLSNGAGLAFNCHASFGRCTCSVKFYQSGHKQNFDMKLEVNGGSWTTSDTSHFQFHLRHNSTSSFYVTCVKTGTKCLFGSYKSEAEYLKALPNLPKDVIVFRDQCSFQKLPLTVRRQANLK